MMCAESDRQMFDTVDLDPPVCTYGVKDASVRDEVREFAHARPYLAETPRSLRSCRTHGNGSLFEHRLVEAPREGG